MLGMLQLSRLRRDFLFDFLSVLLPAVMENPTEELQEEGGASGEATMEEAELQNQAAHTNLKGRQPHAVTETP